jgi:hypothetical protein
MPASQTRRCDDVSDWSDRHSSNHHTARLYYSPSAGVDLCLVRRSCHCFWCLRKETAFAVWPWDHSRSRASFAVSLLSNNFVFLERPRFISIIVLRDFLSALTRVSYSTLSHRFLQHLGLCSDSVGPLVFVRINNRFSDFIPVSVRNTLV